MASFITPVTSNPSSTATSAATAVSSAPQVTEQQFLLLLVAQLKNQDPMSPMDGTQFVSQLAQFSELEQMIGINTGVQKLVTDQGAGNGSTGNGNGSSSTTPAQP